MRTVCEPLVEPSLGIGPGLSCYCSRQTFKSMLMMLAHALIISVDPANVHHLHMVGKQLQVVGADLAVNLDTV